MALSKPKIDWEAPASTPSPARADGAMAAPSSARALQRLLEERTLVATDTVRWSRRRKLAFIVATSCALWLAIVTAFTEAATLIA